MDVSESTAIQQTTNISSRSTYDNKGNKYAIRALNVYCNETSGAQFQSYSNSDT